MALGLSVWPAVLLAGCFYHHCTYNDPVSGPNSRDEEPWDIVVEVRLVVATAWNPSLSL